MVSRDIFSLLGQSKLGSEDSGINSQERAFLQNWQEEWYAHSGASSRHVEPMNVLMLLPAKQVKAHLSEILFKFHRAQHVLKTLKDPKGVAPLLISNNLSGRIEMEEESNADRPDSVIQSPTTKSIPFRMVQAPSELLWEADVLAQQSEVAKSQLSQSPIQQASPTTRKQSHPSSLPTQNDRANTSFGSFSIDFLDSGVSGVLDRVDIPKKQLLDTLMVSFYDMFDSYMGFIHRAESGSSIGSRQFSTASTNSLGKDSSRGGIRRRKGNQDDDLPEEDDDSNSRKRHKKPAKLEDTECASKRRLACPYFKHDPRRYLGLRSCPGPGWDTIHRLK